MVSPAELPHPAEATWDEYLKLDLIAMLTCDRIATLPGWKNSDGSVLEVSTGDSVGILAYEIECFLR